MYYYELRYYPENGIRDKYSFFRIAYQNYSLNTSFTNHEYSNNRFQLTDKHNQVKKMNKQVKQILALGIAIMALSLLTFQTPVSFGIETVAWHEEIITNVTFYGLAQESAGEDLVLVYDGEGTWANGISEVHNYLLYRTSESGIFDLQAHIELAKVGDTTYRMEIYHSVPNWNFDFDMPYSYEVFDYERFTMELTIEANLTGQLGPIAIETLTGPEVSDEGTWHGTLMGNVSFYGALYNGSAGEDLVLVYDGEGTWGNGISEVHNYLLYRTSESGIFDLQAHIELAKVGDTTYRMEIYHSANRVYAVMPYDYDPGVYEYKVDHYLRYEIEADL
jgi:hypothetical protein